MKRPLQPILYYIGLSIFNKGAAMPESFIGVDLHKKSCVFTELDVKGNLIRKGNFSNNNSGINKFIMGLNSKAKITVEPLLNYLWFLDQVSPHVESVHPANPQRVRIIAEAKNKTDSYDSRMLAELLRTNFLPESYYIPKEVRGLRLLLRQRHHLVKIRTGLKSRIRHLLFLNGSVVAGSDISSPKSNQEITELDLPNMTRGSVNQCQELIKSLNMEIKRLEDYLCRSCADIEDVKLLKTIPGIADLRAAIIYSEVFDITRFKSYKKFCSYTGMVPIVRASGDKVYTGSMTKEGSKALRYVFIEAAPTAHRKSRSLGRLYYRTLCRSSPQIAKVAVAHKLAKIVYAMLKNRQPFIEPK
jgi:transposase